MSFAQIFFDASGIDFPNTYRGPSVSAGDFDGDSDIDLFVTGFDESSFAAVVYENTGQNAGSGSLTGSTFSGVQSLTGVNAGSSSTGDFDGDGDLDLVMTGDEQNQSNERAIIYENTGQNAGSGSLGGSTFSEVQNLTGVESGSISIGDFDGDDDLDLIITGNTGDSVQTTVYENTGQNAGSGSLGGSTFSEVQSLPGVSGGSISAGDFDGDEDIDLLIAGSGSATVYENTGQNAGGGSLGGSTFSEVQSLGVVGFEEASTSIGDFDGDGDIDLLVAGRATFTTYQTIIYENTGQNAGGGSLGGSTFSEAQNLTGVRDASTSIGDFDGDGDLDLLITGDASGGVSVNYSVTVYENTGQNAGSGSLDGSTFSEAQSLTGIVGGATTAADLDGDLDLDLFVTGGGNDGGFASIYENTTNNPVPVELTAFTATRDGEGALLRWRTASETNNAGFEVQRLSGEAEAAFYETLGFVDGAGTSSSPRSYQFHTGDLTTGLHRFRLKQVDQDGRVEYSPAVRLQLEIAETYRLTHPAPNPTRGAAQVALTINEVQQVRITIIDLLGREVGTVFRGWWPAHTERVIQVREDLPSGTYFLQVTGERFRTTRRLTVVR